MQLQIQKFFRSGCWEDKREAGGGGGELLGEIWGKNIVYSRYKHE